MPGDQWPIFLFANYKYNKEDPWFGIFKSRLLITVNASSRPSADSDIDKFALEQGYKHVFTSPSSAERETKATRSGNARIHGMTRVTPASIAYIATQVCKIFITE